jgi:hypothetical protein
MYAAVAVFARSFRGVVSSADHGLNPPESNVITKGELAANECSRIRGRSLIFEG